MNQYKMMLQERTDLRAEGNTLLEKAERSAEDAARLEQIKNRLETLNETIASEEKTRELLRNAPGERLSVPAEVRREPEKFGSLGEQLFAIVHNPNDNRLVPAAASGGSTGVASDGGFLVQTDFSNMLLNKAAEASQILPLCDQIPIGANADGLEAPYVAETNRATGSRWGGVRVYRRGEADTVTASKPTIDKFDLRLEDLMGLAYLTDRLMMDAGAMGAIYERAFVSEFAFRVDDELINGTGAGQGLGVLNAPALVTVAKETGQAAATINTANISKMWARMPASLRGGAVWLYNQDCEPELDALSIPAGTAALEPRFVSYDQTGVMRIKGRPALPIEQCATLGTTGDFLLVNWGEYVAITKGGIQADESIHVRFVYGERTLRWIYRINMAPKWKSATTPYKGTTNTQSPYIALATRG